MVPGTYPLESHRQKSVEIVPTAYLAPASYFAALCRPDTRIEVMESFEKQTFRNRCLIHGAQGQAIQMTVPVCKVEHKQLTRDIEISYQTKWQHQHWITLLSAYRHTPYFAYYADYLHPWYEKQTKYLVDLNDGLSEVIIDLINNRQPTGEKTLLHTTDWSGQIWTDQHKWQKEYSILDLIFASGPETRLKIEK